MDTNAVNVGDAFYDFGDAVASSITENLGKIGLGWQDTFQSSTILDFLLVVLGGFIVIVGFWVVAKHLFRAVRATR